MMTLLLQCLRSAAIVAGAGIVLRRFSWREFPALLTWMLWEVAMQAATLGNTDMPTAMLLIQDGICAAVICEVIRSSRLNVSIGAQMRYFLCVVAAAKILASMPDLTARQGWYLFRSYALWAAFLTMAAVTARRWSFAIPERKAMRIYRIGTTCWLFSKAVSASFVRGGVGYMVFPYTRRTWDYALVFSAVTVSAAVIGMCLAMYRSVPARKHAAKRPDGKTVTGRLELVKAA